VVSAAIDVKQSKRNSCSKDRSKGRGWVIEPGNVGVMQYSAARERIEKSKKPSPSHPLLVSRRVLQNDLHLQY